MSSQDCVVTSFFIDCAHNVVEFIELIHRILKPGGKWINFGPLLYHFAEIPRESSIEPSYDIVRSIIEKTGFEFKREGTLKGLEWTKFTSFFCFDLDITILILVKHASAESV